MKKILAWLLLSIVSLAWALTPDEFEQLYNTPKKDGATCYKLYHAYAQGDGVDKDAARARKWLLAAHQCGVEGAREELDNLPWRKALKFKRSIKIAKVDDATARAKGEELVRYLMKLSGPESGSSVSSKDLELSSADDKNIRQLIAAGADLNTVVSDGKVGRYTALSLACRHGNLPLAKLLIEHGADPCADSLLAVEAAHSTYLALPLTAAAPPDKIKRSAKTMIRSDVNNLKTKPSKSMNFGPYPAKTAQELRSIAVMEFLLKNGLEVNMWTNYGSSVAGMLAQFNDVHALMLFSKAGMDVNALQNAKEGVSALYNGNRYNYLQEMFGVKPGMSPLCLAITYYHDCAADTLLRCKADPDLAIGSGKKASDLAEENAQRSEKSGNKEYAQRMVRVKELLKKAAAKNAK